MVARTKKRKSLEAGHKRKFLVLVDETPESERALHYACRRVQHTGGGLILLQVISPADFQHWLGVKNIMREEAMEEARETLRRLGAAVHDQYELTPELTIREGNKAEEIVQLIDEDEDIAILVLGAADDPEGPGPLVAMVAGDGTGRFSIPVTIVPGDLTDDLIDTLA